MADKPDNKNPRQIVQEELEKLMHEGKKELAHEAKKQIPHEEQKQLGIEKLLELKAESRKDVGNRKGEKQIPHQVQKQLGAEKPLVLKEESRKDLESDLIRLQAEFENYRKRAEKELAERTEMGKMEFAKSQIQFLDEFGNALNHLEGEAKKYSGDVSPEISHFFRENVKGIEMLLENFKKSLSFHGVREMECMNQKYDPYLHDVMLQQESDKPEGTVIAVVRKGYHFKESVLRHAQVIVAKKVEKKGE